MQKHDQSAAARVLEQKPASVSQPLESRILQAKDNPELSGTMTARPEVTIDMKSKGGTLKIEAGRKFEITLHTPREITAQLADQRSNIEAEVDKNIDQFLKIENRTFAKKVLMIISYFKNPEDGFKVLKDYMADPDEAKLKNVIRETPARFGAFFSIGNFTAANDQAAEGKNPNNPLRMLQRSAKLLLGVTIISMFARKFHGNLNLTQQLGYEGFHSLGNLKDTSEGSQLHKALHPKMQAAFEKLVDSLETLKEAAKAGTPLLSEEDVRAVRDEVVVETMKSFDRLAEQSFNDKRHNTRATHRISGEMPVPEGVKFGIELEGFIPTDEKFMTLKFKIDNLLRGLGLPVKMALLPKANEDFKGWSVTFDGSVKNPLKFTGAQTASGKVSALGFEVVSPILEGKAGAEQLRKVKQVLDILNFRTNESTGMHVHVDLSTATLEQLKNLGRALIKNEKHLDKLIDQDRRGDLNRFCKPIPENALSGVEKATTIEEFVEAMNPDKDRNRKFDFTGLVLPSSPTTIQYRGEGGANYLPTAGNYAAILITFTQKALNNPDLELTKLSS